jgi:hypothetical protein
MTECFGITKPIQRAPGSEESRPGYPRACCRFSILPEDEPLNGQCSPEFGYWYTH